MTNKQISAVIASPTFGGPYNQIVRLSSTLRDLGYEYTAIVPSEHSSGVRRLADEGISFRTVDSKRVRRSWSPLRQANHFLRDRPRSIRSYHIEFKENPPDLVQVCGLANPEAAIAARRLGIPVVWQFLSDFPPMILRFLTMPHYMRAEVIMATGTKLARAHPGFRIFKERFVPFFPPVDVAAIKEKGNRRGDVRQRLGIKQEKIVIGSFAALGPRKGFDRLIAAFARISQTEPSVHLLIAGQVVDTHPEHAAELQRLAQVHGLGEQVTIVESPPDLYELYAAIDVYALCSDAEGVPTTALEALAAGVPAVLPDVGSISDLARTGHHTLISKPGTVSSTTSLLMQLVRDDALRARMGSQARTSAEKYFSIEACARVHETAFELALR